MYGSLFHYLSNLAEISNCPTRFKIPFIKLMMMESKEHQNVVCHNSKWERRRIEVGFFITYPYTVAICRKRRAFISTQLIKHF